MLLSKIWCMRHNVCIQERNFLWCKQTQLFRYSVNSTILFSKSFWTRFIRLTYFEKFYVAHDDQGVSVHSLKCWPPYEMYPSPRKGIFRSLPKFRYSFIFFQPLSFTSYPRRLELQIPPNWDMGGWIASWYEMHIFQRCRLRQTKMQTETDKLITKLVTPRPCHKNSGLKE